MEIAIIGASGYTGGELMRLLLNHSPQTSSPRHPGSWTAPPSPRSIPTSGVDRSRLSEHRSRRYRRRLAFLAVPAHRGDEGCRDACRAGIRTVDLSADYRLAKDVYEKTYGVRHEAYFEAPYGLVELHRDEVRGASFVANPGCFPTGATLAAAPLAKFAHTIIYDSKTGVTGAGNTPSGTTHYPNVGDNYSAYKWTTHRHLAEMKQEAARLGSTARCYFTPHLLPVNRGILTTAHILLEPMEQDEVEALYRKFYKDEFFVRYQNRPLPPCGNELLRRGRGERGRPGRRDLGDRQPGQGRKRPGDPEHEPDVRVCGRRRSPLRRHASMR